MRIARRVLGPAIALCILGVGCAQAAIPARAGPVLPPRLDPDAVDPAMDVSTLNAEQVRLYRGAVQARHCWRFADGPLRGEFRDYQERRCGVRSFVDEPAGRRETPPDSAFSVAESMFLRRLDQREARLRAGQVVQTTAGPAFARDAIVNLSQFSSLPDSVVARLLRDGFVVQPARHAQLSEVYEQNDYLMIPSFITVDAALHVYHLYFDYALRQLEERSLLPAATQLCRALGERLLAQYAIAPDASRAEALRRALLYVAVAATLAGPDSTTAPPAWVKPGWRADLDAQLALVRAATDSRHYGPVLGTVDYTMFRPRGHYTRNANLSRYFRTMMWLGLPGFSLDERQVPLATGLCLVHALARDPALRDLYDRLYESTRFYVGPTDDITPTLVWTVADSLCGEGASLDQWLARGEAIRAELVRRNPTRIRTQFGDDRDGPQIRLMGMRYIPDAEVLQRLCFSPYRARPTGLDLFAAMSVPAALELQHADPGLGPDNPDVATRYWPALAKLQAQFGDFRPAPAADNLYTRWLHLLRTVNQPAPVGAAACMRTPAWDFKNLSTSLASWAQLRHDTILYAKQSASAECGGGEEPPRVVGYVEARPDVFGEMAELQRFTLAELSRRNLLPRDLRDTGRRVEETLAFLDTIARREVAGQPLTDRQLEEIRVFGAQLEYLARELLSDEGGLDALVGTNRTLATVADVHTRNSPAGDRALEEGVGYGDELLALVVIEGGLYVTRGAVLSYYEFEHPAQDRLTDEKWQGMLDKGAAPPRPRWTTRFLIQESARPLLARYLYSSGC